MVWVVNISARVKMAALATRLTGRVHAPRVGPGIAARSGRVAIGRPTDPVANTSARVTLTTPNCKCFIEPSLVDLNRVYAMKKTFRGSVVLFRDAT